MAHSFDIVRTRSSACLVRTDLADAFDPGMFSAAYWQDRSAIVGTAEGRGPVQFVQSGDLTWVLRHYLRGGLIGRLIHRSYLYTGLEATRSFAELRLLGHLFDGGLCVPRPVAALCERHGLLYRAALLTEAVEHDQTLFECLRTCSEQLISTDLMTSVGETIGQMHALGVDHADLNAHNILLSDGQVVAIIDFDRGRIRQGTGWQNANLQRLQRSFSKALTEAGHHDQLPDLMAALQQGYRKSD